MYQSALTLSIVEVVRFFFNFWKSYNIEHYICYNDLGCIFNVMLPKKIPEKYFEVSNHKYQCMITNPRGIKSNEHFSNYFIILIETTFMIRTIVKTILIPWSENIHKFMHIYKSALTFWFTIKMSTI